MTFDEWLKGQKSIAEEAKMSRPEFSLSELRAAYEAGRAEGIEEAAVLSDLYSVYSSGTRWSRGVRTLIDDIETIEEVSEHRKAIESEL